MSNITQPTAFTKIKQTTDHDARNFGPLVLGYEPQVSTPGQTVINLSQFVCDLANKAQIMLVVDGQILTEGASNDFTWTVGQNNTSAQAVLNAAIVAGLNIQIWKLGAPRSTLPNADSLQASINLGVSDTDKMYSQYAINGGFVHWQEGTSFAAIANSTYFADQWRYFKNGTMVHTASRVSNPSTNPKSRFAAQLACTTADVSIAASDFCVIEQPVEGEVLERLRGKNIVIGFTVFSSKTGTFCTAARDGANTKSLIKEYSVTAANTPQRRFVRFTHDESAAAWAYDNTLGMRLFWTLAAGTDYQTTANTWQTGSLFATANQVNACDSNTGIFTITEVVICEDNATQTREPEYKPFGGNLNSESSMVKRYFYQFPNTSASICNGVWATTTQVYADIRYPNSMRVAPAVAIVGAASGIVLERPGTSAASVSSFSAVANNSVDGGTLQFVSGSSHVAGHGTRLYLSGSNLSFNSRM